MPVVTGCFCVAPQHKQKEQLWEAAEKLPEGPAKESLKASTTVERFMRDPKLNGQLRPMDLLIVDESSLADTRMGHEILKTATERRWRVLFVGDQRQKTAIRAGDWYRHMIKFSRIEKVELDKIIRQREDALGGAYLKAAYKFAKSKSTEAFKILDDAGRLIEQHGRKRLDVIADLYMSLEEKGTPAMSINTTHRECDGVSEAIRKRKTELGQLTDEREFRTYRSLGWTEPELRKVEKFQAGQIIEITTGTSQGWHGEIESVTKKGNHWKAIAVDARGQRREFGASNSRIINLSEKKALKVAIGDVIMTHSQCKCADGTVETNGQRFKITGFDPFGNIVSGKHTIVSRNISYAYASTVIASQGATKPECIFGMDRASINSATIQDAYVSCLRGRVGVHVVVENKADVAGLQNRSGERPGCMEMQLDQERLPENIKQTMREIERLRSPKEKSTSNKLIKFSLQQSERKKVIEIEKRSPSVYLQYYEPQ
jgi:AAA domain